MFTMMMAKKQDPKDPKGDPSRKRDRQGEGGGDAALGNGSSWGSGTWGSGGWGSGGWNPGGWKRSRWGDRESHWQRQWGRNDLVAGTGTARELRTLG